MPKREGFDKRLRLAKDTGPGTLLTSRSKPGDPPGHDEFMNVTVSVVEILYTADHLHTVPGNHIS